MADAPFVAADFVVPTEHRARNFLLRPLRASKKLKREDEMTVFNNCEQLRGVATALLAQIQGAGGALA